MERLLNVTRAGVVQERFAAQLTGMARRDYGERREDHQ